MVPISIVNEAEETRERNAKINDTVSAEESKSGREREGSGSERERERERANGSHEARRWNICSAFRPA
jgi:hypothetical protein